MAEIRRAMAEASKKSAINKFAPRPPHRSRMQYLYDTLEALGGGTVGEVHKYLPAAQPEGAKQITKTGVRKGLYNGKYRGYFIRKGNKYFIAPYDYYKVRYEFCSSRDKSYRRDQESRKEKQMELPLQQEVLSDDEFLTMAKRVVSEVMDRPTPPPVHDNHYVRIPCWIVYTVTGTGLVAVGYLASMFIN